MKKSLLFKGLFVAAMLCVSVAANAETFYYRTFHVVAQNMTGNGSIYITTQTDPGHGEYAKFDTDLDAGFACTLSNGYGRRMQKSLQKKKLRQLHLLNIRKVRLMLKMAFIQ